MVEKNKPRTGLMLRGQAWVELHGEFTSAQLRDIAKEIEKNCKGLENKNVNPGRPNN